MNIPKLRFPEFSGEWEEKKLNKIFYKITKRNTDKKNTNVITNSATEGLISQRDYFDKDIANIEKTDNYFVIQNGDFVYNPRKSSSAPYGPFTQYKLTNDGIVSPLYLCLRKIESTVDSKFLENYFKTSCWHQYIYENGSAGARHDRVSIHDDILLEMPLKIPSLPEQQKIADFLSTVDSIIASETKILNALQKKKKALMQKLFSQQFRFKADDGSEFPEWEEKKLGDIASFSKGSGYSKGDLCETGTPIILYGRMYTKYETSISEIDTYVSEKDNSVFSKGNEIIVPASGETAEDISRASVVKPAGIILGGDLNIIKVDTEEFFPEFIALCISNGEPKKRMAKLAQGKTIVHLHNSNLQQLVFELPCKEEQQKIADCLSSLDNLIQNQQKIVTNWQQRKKGLLQQMFI